jgi:hypothetical protein
VRRPLWPDARRSSLAAPRLSFRAAQLLSLQSNDREFLTKERATELLAPLLAPDAPYSKARAARGAVRSPCAPQTLGCGCGSRMRAARGARRSWGRSAAPHSVS